MKSTILFLALLGLPGCATLGKGADWYNAHGPRVSVNVFGFEVTLQPRLQNPPVEADAGFGPKPAPPTAEAPTAGNEVAKK